MFHIVFLFLLLCSLTLTSYVSEAAQMLQNICPLVIILYCWSVAIRHKYDKLQLRFYFLFSSRNLCTVKRPKFGIVPYVRHPLYELLKNHIFAWAEVSDLVQRGEKLYIFFCTNKKINIWGSPCTIYDLQQLGPCMSKLGNQKCESVLFFLHEGYIFWGVFRVKKLCIKSAW